MVVFINDILIYFKSDKEHAKHLKVVLDILREKKLVNALVLIFSNPSEYFVVCCDALKMGLGGVLM